MTVNEKPDPWSWHSRQSHRFDKINQSLDQSDRWRRRESRISSVAGGPYHPSMMMAGAGLSGGRLPVRSHWQSSTGVDQQLITLVAHNAGSRAS